LIFYPLPVHGLKSPEAYVKRNLRDLYSTVSHRGNSFWGEMQACGRSGYLTALPRIDSLVSLPVARGVWTVDVGWQWDMPEPLYRTVKVGGRFEPDAALAKGAARHDLSLQWMVIAKKEPLTNTDLSPGADEAFPIVRIDRHLPCEQDFNPAFEEIFRGRISRADYLSFRPASHTIQTRRKDPCVVEHDQVIRAEECRKIAKPDVAHLSRTAIYME